MTDADWKVGDTAWWFRYEGTFARGVVGMRATIYESRVTCVSLNNRPLLVCYDPRAEPAGNPIWLGTEPNPDGKRAYHAFRSQREAEDALKAPGKEEKP